MFCSKKDSILRGPKKNRGSNFADLDVFCQKYSWEQLFRARPKLLSTSSEPEVAPTPSSDLRSSRLVLWTGGDGDGRRRASRTHAARGERRKLKVMFPTRFLVEDRRLSPLQGRHVLAASAGAIGPTEAAARGVLGPVCAPRRAPPEVIPRHLAKSAGAR